jgi:Flp pilus assembly pilin Flp
MTYKGTRDNQRGASLVEYALLVSLIALVAIAGVRALGEATHRQLSASAVQLNPG